MSNLRSSTIKLAHANPKLRKHLLPLLKKASEDMVRLTVGGLTWEVYPLDNGVEDVEKDIHKILPLVRSAMSDPALRKPLRFSAATFHLTYDGLDVSTDSFSVVPDQYAKFLEALIASGWTRTVEMVRSKFTNEESRFVVVPAEGSHFIIGRK